MATTEIILASASPVRARLLRQAGVSVGVMPAQVDEPSLKQAAQNDGMSATDTAMLLAETKARQVSLAQPGTTVIGADQMLVCGQKWLDKPGHADGVADHLRQLRGTSHDLISAVVIFGDGRRLWGVTDQARLGMWDFSDAFLADYVKRYGEDVCHSVGAYHMEDAGVALFDRIEGDFFTILGIPLLPLLRYLRQAGLVDI